LLIGNLERRSEIEEIFNNVCDFVFMLHKKIAKKK
jgi:hypothetical protein